MNLCCGFLLILALVGSSAAKSINKDQSYDVVKTFTSELDDSFQVTLPKTAAINTDEDVVKSTNEEKHIPVKVVHGEEEGVAVKLVSEDAKVVDDATVVVVKESNSAAASVDVAKKDPVVAVKDDENQVKVDEPVEKIDDKREECDESEKSVPPRVKAEEVVQEEAPTPVQTPVNLIQQGIANLGQGIRNVTTSISNSINSVLRPDPSSPTIIENIQSGIQNLFSPQTQRVDGDNTTLSAEVNGTASRPPSIGAIVTSYANIVQHTISNFTTALQNIIRDPVGAANNTFNTMQQNVNQLQTTLGGAVQNLTQIIQFRPPNSNSTSPTISSIISGLTNTLNTNIQTLNMTISSILRPIFNRPQSDTPTHSDTRNEEITTPIDLSLIHQQLQKLNQTLIQGANQIELVDNDEKVVEPQVDKEVAVEPKVDKVVVVEPKIDKVVIEPQADKIVVDEKIVEKPVVVAEPVAVVKKEQEVVVQKEKEVVAEKQN